jgi:hypothetical protein
MMGFRAMYLRFHLYLSRSTFKVCPQLVVPASQATPTAHFSLRRHYVQCKPCGQTGLKSQMCDLDVP